MDHDQRTPFRQCSGNEDRKKFDKMFSLSKLYDSACSIDDPILIRHIMMPILFHHYKRLLVLHRAIIDDNVMMNSFPQESNIDELDEFIRNAINYGLEKFQQKTKTLLITFNIQSLDRILAIKLAKSYHALLCSLVCQIHCPSSFKWPHLQ